MIGYVGKHSVIVYIVWPEIIRFQVVDMHGPLKQGFQINGKDLFIPCDGDNSQIAFELIADVIASQMPVFRKSKLIPNRKP